MFAIAFFVASVGAFVLYESGNEGNGSMAADFTGYIPISTPQELAMIGNDLGYPLYGKYYLTNDIVFTSGDDTNGGIDIGLSVTVTGTSLVATVTPSSGSVSSLYAWLGTYSDTYTNSDSVTLTGIPTGIHTLVLGGMVGSDPFTYSMEVDTDINSTSTAFNSNGNFSPIGSEPTPFTGVFDGDGHFISGMEVSVFSNTLNVYAGLFGVISGEAQILNLAVADGSVTASSFSSFVSAGGVVGFARANIYTNLSPSITVSNCYNASPVTASASIQNGEAYAGGIVGCADSYGANSVIITDCNNTGSVTALSPENAKACAGGTVGYAYAYPSQSSIISTISISWCCNSGSVIATSPKNTSTLYAGGIVGHAIAYAPLSSIEILGCYNSGLVITSSPQSYLSCAGGIVGHASASAPAFTHSVSITVYGCYNTGSVMIALLSQMNAHVGGIVGYAYATSSTGAYAVSMTISNCYNTGSVAASTWYPAHAGGIVGTASTTPPQGSIHISNCYSTGSVNASSPSYNAVAGGTVGYAGVSSSMTITNCYFIGGQIIADSIGDGTVTIDGNGGGASGNQSSGAKSPSDMAPSLEDAKDGDSIYYTGSTIVNSETIYGWDFEGTWTIVSGVNDGYPILSSLPLPLPEAPESKTLTGTVWGEGIPLSGAIISYNGTSTTTGLDGKYAITVGAESLVVITDINRDGYTVDQALPMMIKMTDNKVQDFEMSAEAWTFEIEVLLTGDGSVMIYDGKNTTVLTSIGRIYLPLSESTITVTAVNGGDVFEMFVFDSTDAVYFNSLKRPINGDMVIEAYFIHPANYATMYHAVDVTVVGNGTVRVYNDAFTNTVNVPHARVNFPVSDPTLKLTAFGDTDSFEKFVFDSTHTTYVDYLILPIAGDTTIEAYFIDTADYTTAYYAADIAVTGNGVVEVYDGIHTNMVYAPHHTNMVYVPPYARVNVPQTATSIKLTAINGTDSFEKFGIVGGEYTTSYLNPTTIAISAYVYIAAVFGQTPVNYNITVDVTGTGNVTVTGAEGYYQTVSVTSTLSVPASVGSDLTFTVSTATPNVFVSLALNGGAADRKSPIAYTVANGDTVYAVFNSSGTHYNITVDITGTGSVTVIGAASYSQTVTSTSLLSVPVTAGYSLTFAASTTGADIFVSFTLNGGMANITSPLTYTVTDSDTVYAVFGPVSTYSLTVDLTGTGWVVVTSASGYMATVTSTTTLAIPVTAGYSLTFAAFTTGVNVFVSLTLNSGTADNATPQTYTVANGDTVYAVFEYSASTYYNITVDITGTGSVTVIGAYSYSQTVTVTSLVSVPVAAGYTLTFTASATSPNVFVSLTLNGGMPDRASPQSYTQANGDTVYAVFDSSASTYYNIVVDVTGAGIVAVTGAGYSQIVNITSTVAVPVTASYGPIFTALTTGTNVFVSFNLNAGTPDYVSPRTYAVANGDTVYAVFGSSATRYNIEVDVVGTGSVTVAGTGYLYTVTVKALLSVPVTAGYSLTFYAFTTAPNVFAGFILNAGADDRASPQTYTVANGDTIYARFDPFATSNYNILVDITAYPSGAGSVTVTSPGGYSRTVSVTSLVSVPVSEGYSLTFSASSTAPYVFDSFALNAGADDKVSPKTYMVANGDVVYARFIDPIVQPPAFTLGININPVYGGTIDLYIDGTFDATVITSYSITLSDGAVVSLTATPASGMSFYKWTFNGTAPALTSGSVSTAAIEFMLDDNYDITASFADTADIVQITLLSYPAGANLFYTIGSLAEMPYTTPFNVSISETLNIRAEATHSSISGAFVRWETFAGAVAMSASMPVTPFGASMEFYALYDTSGGTDLLAVTLAQTGGASSALAYTLNGAYFIYTAPFYALLSDTLSLSASAVSGYTFLWWDNGTAIVSLGAVSLQMSIAGYASAVTFTAWFATVANAVQITLSSTPAAADLFFTIGSLAEAAYTAPFNVSTSESLGIRAEATHNVSSDVFLRWESGGVPASSSATMSVTPSGASMVFDAVYGSPGYSTVTITGTVSDGVDPIEGAVVSYDGTSTTTNSEGKYAIIAEYGSTVTITGVTKDGYTVFQWLPMEFTMTGDIVQDFEMGRNGLTVSGRVTVDGTAKGVKGATVEYTVNGVQHWASTAFDGTYSLMMAFAGDTVVITGVSCPEYTLASGTVPSQPFTTDTDGVDFTMIADFFTVSGKVTVDGTGASVVGATITYTLNGWQTDETTYADGTYEIYANKGDVITIIGVSKTDHDLVSGTIPSPLFTSDADNVDFTMSLDYSGFIAIRDPWELAMIGNDPLYPLEGGYYLANDIFFNSGDDTNGGTDIGISAIVTGTTISVTLSPSNGSVTSMYAWFGNLYAYSMNNSVTLTDIPQGRYVLTVGGMLDSSTPFAYSVEIDAATSGEKAGVVFNSNGNFDPIGSAYDPFTGIFEGRGHIISGISVSVLAQDWAYSGGLFGATSGAKIYNTGVVDGYVICIDASAGGIVGFSENTSVTDCFNTCLVMSSTSAAGIIGSAPAYGGAVVITDCFNAGAIAALGTSDYTHTIAGGIVGDLYPLRGATVADCYNVGVITASAVTSTTSANAYANAGGIAGLTNGTFGPISITDCFNNGTVAASMSALMTPYYVGASAGGIVGWSAQPVLFMTNCYNAGLVEAYAAPSADAHANVGGMIGYGGATAITNCYSLGNSTVVNGEFQDFFYYSADIIDGYKWWSLRDGIQGSGTKYAPLMTPSLAVARSGDSVYYTGTTLINSEPIGGWDFYNKWRIVPGVNDGYPILRSFLDFGSDTVVLTGTVSVWNNPFESTPLGGVVVQYGGTSTVTDSEGKYVIAVQRGSVLTVTDVVMAGYEVDQLLPMVFTMTGDKGQDFTMSVDTGERFSVSIDTVSPGSKAGQVRYSFDNGNTWSDWGTQFHLSDVVGGRNITVEMKVEEPCKFSYWMAEWASLHYSSSQWAPQFNSQVIGDVNITAYFTDDSPKSLKVNVNDPQMGFVVLSLNDITFPVFIQDTQTFYMTVNTVVYLKPNYTQPYRFTHWVADHYIGIDPVPNPFDPNLTFSMDGDKEVTAFFGAAPSLPSGISTADELYLLAEYTNEGRIYGGDFYLLNDINLNDLSPEYKERINWSEKGWLPIGYRNVFYGSFDGCGYKVTGLWIDREESVGLFGAMNDGTIVNLAVETDSVKGVSGRGSVGVLVGTVYNGIIENCYASGEINISDTDGNAWDYVGGLVGSFSGNRLFGSHSSVNIKVESNKVWYVGGFVGYVGYLAEVSECYSEGSIAITITELYEHNVEVGGFAGIISGATVTDCYTQCNIMHDAEDAIWSASFDTILFEFFYGIPPSSGIVGGFAGNISYSSAYYEYEDTYIEWNSTVTNTFAGGKTITHGDVWVGGFAGRMTGSANVSGNYYIQGEYHDVGARVVQDINHNGIDDLTEEWYINQSGLDTDGDGASDLMEIAYGSDPNDPNSIPGDIDGDGIPDWLDPDYVIPQHEVLSKIGIDVAGAEPLTGTEMTQMSSFAGWDTTDVWGIYEGHGHPFLLAFGNDLLVAPLNAQATDYQIIDGGSNYDPARPLQFIFTTDNGEKVLDRSAENVGYYQVSVLRDLYTITTSVIGGSVTPTANVGAGGDWTVSFSPSPGFQLESVKVDGAYLTPTEMGLGYYTFYNVLMNHTVEVVCTQTSYYYSLVIERSIPQAGAVYVTVDGTTSPYGGLRSILSGKEVTIEAIPSSGYVFMYWNMDAECIGDASVTFTIDHDTAAIAVFASEEVVIDWKALTVLPAQGGKIRYSWNDGDLMQDITGYADTRVPGGVEVTFSVIPDEGYEFSKWTVDGARYGSLSTVHHIMSEDMTIGAEFAIMTFDVTLVSGDEYDIAPYGGSTSPVEYNGDFTFQVVPHAGITAKDYAFVNGKKIQLDNDGKFTVTGIKERISVTAPSPVKYYIGLMQGDGYVLEGVGSTSPVNPGESFTFKLTVLNGYTVGSVRVNGIEVALGIDHTYTITNIQDNKSVSVGLIKYAVTLFNGPHYKLAPYEGQVTSNNVYWCNYDEDFFYTLTVDAGYVYAFVLVNGEPVELQGGIGHIKVNGTKTVTVEGVELERFDVTLQDGTGYMLSSSQGPTVGYGGDYKFYFFVESGYSAKYAQINVNGQFYCFAGSTGWYTIKNIRSDVEISVSGVKPAYTVTMSRGEGYVVSPSGYMYSVTEHDSFEFNIRAAAGYTVEDMVVRVDGAALVPYATYNGTQYYRINDITGNKVVTVEGVKHLYKVSHVGASGVTFSPVNGSSSTVKEGGSYQFKLTVLYGYDESSLAVTVNGTPIFPDSNGIYTISPVLEDKEIELSISRVYFTVEVLPGTGFTTSPGPGTYVYYLGQTLRFSYTVDTANGYDGASGTVSINGTAIGNGPREYVRTVTENMVVSVSGVALRQYSITAGAGVGYTISGPPATVGWGSDFGFTVTMDAGFVAKDVKVNGVSFGSDTTTPFMIFGVKENKHITVELLQYSVTLHQGARHTVSAYVGSSSPVNPGESFTFQVSVDPGYKFDYVSVNGQRIDPGDLVKVDENTYRYTISDIQGNKDVRVGLVSYTVYLYQGEGYKILPLNQTSAGGYSVVTRDVLVGDPPLVFTVTITDGYKANAQGLLVKSSGSMPQFVSSSGPVYTYTVAVTGDTVLTVENVEPKYYTVDLIEGDNYTLAPMAGYDSPVRHGGSYRFTLTPDTGYTAEDARVYANNVLLSKTNGYYAIQNIRADQVVTVTYVKELFSVSVSPGAGVYLNTTPGPGALKEGSSFTIRYMSGHTGYNISGVSVYLDGAKITSLPFTFTVTGNHVITTDTATRLNYNVIVSVYDGYSLAPQGLLSSPVDYGGSFTFKVVPGTYGLDAAVVTVDGVVRQLSSEGTITISNITKDVKVSVYAKRYDVKVSSSTAYQIDTGGSQSYTLKDGYVCFRVVHGEAFSFGLTPNIGYDISMAYCTSDIGYYYQDNNGVFTIPSVTQDVTMDVIGAKRLSFTITLIEGLGCKLTPLYSTTVYYGDDFMFTLTATAGYSVQNAWVEVDGAAWTGTNGEYVIANVTSDKTVAAGGAEVVIPKYGVFLTQTQHVQLYGVNGSSTPVTAGGSFTFKVEVDPPYILKSVTVNGVPVTLDMNGEYTIASIHSDQWVYVNLLTYNVSLVNGTGYKLVTYPTPGMSTTVYSGESLSFTLQSEEGYTLEDALVYDNGVRIYPNIAGIYTISNVTGDHTVFATGVRLQEFDVSFIQGTGYFLDTDSPFTLQYGDDFTFWLMALPGYNIAGAIVQVNGEPLKRGGSLNGNIYYTIKDIKEDKVITVTGVERQLFIVKLTQGTGYTLSPEGGSSSPVQYGGSYSFTLEDLTGYDISQASVWVNGIIKLPDPDGVYRITDITSNLTVTVTGVKEVPQPCVLSVSYADYGAVLWAYRSSDGIDFAGVGPGTVNLYAGQTVALEAVPDDGYLFDSWIVISNGKTSKYSATNISLKMSGDATVTAIFKPVPPEYFTVTVAQSQYGTVAWMCEGDSFYGYGDIRKESGTVLLLIAEGNTINGVRYTLDFWKVSYSVDGYTYSFSTGDSTLVLELEHDTTVTPIFKAAPNEVYRVEVVPTVNGSVEWIAGGRAGTSSFDAEDGTVATFKAIADEGHSLSYWQVDGLVYMDSEISVTVDGPKTVWAVFKAEPTVTVQFDTGAGSPVQSQTIPFGAAASPPADPVWAQHEFSYWELGGVRYDFSAPVTEDITLTAVWEWGKVTGLTDVVNFTAEFRGGYVGETVPITFAITENTGFNSAGIRLYLGTSLTLEGAEVVGPYSGFSLYVVGTTVFLEAPTFDNTTATGEAFVVWVRITGADDVGIGISSVGVACVPDTFGPGAKWTVDEVIINGTQCNDPSVQAAAVGEVFSVKGAIAGHRVGDSELADGYVWLDPNAVFAVGEHGYDALNTVSNTVFMLIVDAAAPQMHTVAFDSDGGTPVPSASVEHGFAATEPAPPSKGNYVFAGWYIDGVRYDFATAVTGDITLKAAWDPVLYYVSISPGKHVGGLLTSTNGIVWKAYTGSVAVAYGGDLWVRASIDAGYLLEGWGDGTTVNPYHLATVGADISLTPTAKLDANYTIISALEKTVRMGKSPDRVGERLDIPSTVEIGGEVYTVTEIASDAFDDLVGAESISVPSTVTKIEPGTFSGLTDLKIVAVADGTLVPNDAFDSGAQTVVAFYSGATSVEASINGGIVSINVPETDPGMFVRRISAGSTSGGHDLDSSGSGGVWAFNSAGLDEVYVHVVQVSEVLVGDIDNSGNISLGDVMLLRMLLAGYDMDYDKGLADVDNNGNITPADILFLRMILAELVERPEYEWS